MPFILPRFRWNLKRGARVSFGWKDTVVLLSCLCWACETELRGGRPWEGAFMISIRSEGQKCSGCFHSESLWWTLCSSFVRLSCAVPVYACLVVSWTAVLLCCVWAIWCTLCSSFVRFLLCIPRLVMPCCILNNSFVVCHWSYLVCTLQFFC